MPILCSAGDRKNAWIRDESIAEYNQTVIRIRPPLAGADARGLRAIVVSSQL